MEMATCVLTCSSWFSMSRMTCLIIFSGSSALSIRSLRFARMSVETRSKSAMLVAPIYIVAARGPWGPRRILHLPHALRLTIRLGRFLADSADLRAQLAHIHTRERFEESRYLRRNLGDVT